MCLTYDALSTEKFWKSKSRKNKNWCWCWKNVCVYKGIVSSPHRDNEISPGWLISDRVEQAPFIDGMDNVFYFAVRRGIHVYSDSLVITAAFPNEYCHSIRVKCYKKDFVAASVSSRKGVMWHANGGEAVFMKVFVPRSEIDRVLRKAKND
jgi:hypothetical protein